MKRTPWLIIFWMTLLGFLLAAGQSKASRHVFTQTKMLFFYQEGCHWCAHMDKILKEPRMKRLLGHTRVFRINVRGQAKIPILGKTGEDLARKFKVRRIPTIIVLGTKEKVLLRIPGALSEEDFQEVVSQYVPGDRRE